jgi:hypothetical protein
MKIFQLFGGFFLSLLVPLSPCDFSWGIGFIRIRLNMSFKPSKSQLGQTVLMD